MKRNIIKIEGKAVIVTTTPTGNYIGKELGNGIWMTVWEIAEAFNVSGTAVVSAIKAIRKTDILNDYEVCKYIHMDNGNTADVYSLEMIIPIAFRLNTYYTDIFRKWIVSKVYEKKTSEQQFYIHIPNGGYSCGVATTERRTISHLGLSVFRFR